LLVLPVFTWIVKYHAPFVASSNWFFVIKRALALCIATQVSKKAMCYADLRPMTGTPVKEGNSLISKMSMHTGGRSVDLWLERRD
jgi:hypothetical protein